MYWLMIGLGAAVGAVVRGYLARFNGVHSWLPFGTLSANVLGGLLIGVALAYSERFTPIVRALVTTGFLGGLTTFSTFSAETFGLLNTGRIAAALSLIGLHVIFTLAATALGFYAVKLVA